MAQLLPFQCSLSATAVPPRNAFPTAKQLLMLGHDTPFNTVETEPAGFGLEGAVHAGPALAGDAVGDHEAGDEAHRRGQKREKGRSARAARSIGRFVFTP